jgi:hypothetical protein
MLVLSPKKITLDYRDAASDDLLENLSGAAADGEFLWTVSDEGRTLECLKSEGEGFTLKEQFKLDTVFGNTIPGALDTKPPELDLESIDIADGRLWLCGSHCRVREKPLVKGAPIKPNSAVKEPRTSRYLFASIALMPDGKLGKAQALPFDKPGSLRDCLSGNEFLKPFLELPSKENGFDIEGLAVIGKTAYIGLRGPLIDSFAVVIALTFGGGFAVSKSAVHFLDLGGLAIRDLAHDANDLLVIAGPVSDASSPFRLARWTPGQPETVQKVISLFDWPLGSEKPEGMTLLNRGGTRGLILFYDKPDDVRISGKTYAADWLPL